MPRAPAFPDPLAVRTLLSNSAWSAVSLFMLSTSSLLVARAIAIALVAGILTLGPRAQESAADPLAAEN